MSIGLDLDKNTLTTDKPNTTGLANFYSNPFNLTLTRSKSEDTVEGSFRSQEVTGTSRNPTDEKEFLFKHN